MIPNLPGVSEKHLPVPAYDRKMIPGTKTIKGLFRSRIPTAQEIENRRKFDKLAPLYYDGTRYHLVTTSVMDFDYGSESRLVSVEIVPNRRN